MTYEESEVLALRAEITDLRKVIADLQSTDPVVQCQHCGWQMRAPSAAAANLFTLEAEHEKHYRRFHGRISVPPSPWPGGVRPEPL